MLAHEDTAFFNKPDGAIEWTFNYEAITIAIKEIDKNQYTWFWTVEEREYFHNLIFLMQYKYMIKEAFWEYNPFKNIQSERERERE